MTSKKHTGNAEKIERSQAERFKEVARELGADDDEAAFNEKLRKLVKQKPDDKKSSED